MVEFGTVVLLIIIGFILYKIFSGSKSKQLSQPGDHRMRRTGRGSSQQRKPPQQRQQDRQHDQTRSSIIQSAKRQENMGNLDEASRLYLRGGQVFSAAKMKALKGPQEANNVIEIVQINAPDQVDMITQNLINEFYYRLNQPATAAALLRGLGRHEEAEAVEVAANITPPTKVETFSTPVSSIPATQPIQSETTQYTEVVTEEPIKTEISQETIKEDEPEFIPVDKSTISNSLMMASAKLSDNCVVCRRSISSGDSFIYCLNCGKPGHYKHLAEIMKVTGKCPNCKQKLRISMYEI